MHQIVEFLPSKTSLPASGYGKSPSWDVRSAKASAHTCSLWFQFGTRVLINRYHLLAFYTTTTNMSNSLDAFELRKKYKHFRVLVIGRANAGKTTLLKRVCNTTEEPCIYDEHNNNLVSFVLIRCIIPVLIVPL